jgi:hypothetical protein
MPVSINPKASYHLCPDFSTGTLESSPLQLGSILKNLDVDGLAPVNERSLIPVPEEERWPRNGPDVKRGLKFSMSDLKSAEFSVWAKVFGANGLGGKLGWLSKWTEDEDLTIDALKTRYFNPDDKYMAKVLASRELAARLKVTKKKLPIYMITGLKWVEGASLTKKAGRTHGLIAEGGGVDPNTGIAGGGTGNLRDEETAEASFKESSDFTLGYRVRKISWNVWGKQQIDDKVAGAVLEDGHEKPTVLAGVDYVDDYIGENAENIDDAVASGKAIVDADGENEELFVWILP